MSLVSGTVYLQNASRGLKNTSDISSYQNQSLKLDELEKRAEMILFEARSLRPLFSKNKDRITICPNRVTITRGNWFSLEEYPMSIENITSARIYRYFMYAVLDIDTFGIAKPEPLKHMRLDDARLARRYILALIECKKAEIDLSGLGISELRDRLKDLGTVRYTSEEKDYHRI